MFSSLSVEDKIRLECVSKQWRRLVFNKQFVIELNFERKDNKNTINRALDKKRQLNEQHLESVLKRCQNIVKVDFELEVNSSVLSLIGRYCPNIKSLSYDYNIEDNVLSFFLIYGHKLEQLILSHDNDSNRLNDEEINKMLNFIKYCPNLKIIYYPINAVLIIDDKEYLPKLESIKAFEVDSNEVNRLKILSEKYSQNIKSLDVILCAMGEEDLKTCIEYIIGFENLKRLKLKLVTMVIKEPVDAYLTMIGQKFNKLLKLDLVIDSFVSISDRFFDVFSEFKLIKELKIELYHKTVVKGSIASLKHCKQIKNLYIRYPELKEDFFANIASFVPKLEFLGIETEKQYSDSFIDSFIL